MLLLLEETTELVLSLIKYKYTAFALARHNSCVRQLEVIACTFSEARAPASRTVIPTERSERRDLRSLTC